MTPHSFFTIVLKILGIYFLIEILRSIFEFSKIAYLAFAEYSEWDEIVFPILMLAFFLLLVWLLLFRTGAVIVKLGLAQNFDEEKFELNIHRSSVIQIALIIIGVLIIKDYLHNFIAIFYDYFFVKHTSYDGVFYQKTETNLYEVVFPGCMLFLGYYLMRHSRNVTNMLEKWRRDN
ncbi:MAG: hypothetical protein V4613_03990 [Bacteroidota bacterium]